VTTTTAPTTEQGSLLPDDVEQAAIPLEPIDLPTPRHALVARIALESRAEELEKLAKKNKDEQYPREARVMELDAMMLREDLIPQLRDQVEIPLATGDEVKGAVANQLRDLVRRFVKRDPDGEEDYEAQMLDKLSERVGAFASALAERAFHEGFIARQQTAEVIALKCVDQLSAFPTKPGAL
jgi:hypothetical protein